MEKYWKVNGYSIYVKPNEVVAFDDYEQLVFTDFGVFLEWVLAEVELAEGVVEECYA